MSIYDGNRINYGSAIQAMIQNAERGGQIRSNYQKQQGELWGNTMKDLSGAFARGLVAYNQMKEPTNDYSEAIELPEGAEYAKIPGYTYSTPVNDEADAEEYLKFVKAMQGLNMFGPNAVVRGTYK